MERPNSRWRAILVNVRLVLLFPWHLAAFSIEETLAGFHLRRLDRQLAKRIASGDPFIPLEFWKDEPELRAALELLSVHWPDDGRDFAALIHDCGICPSLEAALRISNLLDAFGFVHEAHVGGLTRTILGGAFLRSPPSSLERLDSLMR